MLRIPSMNTTCNRQTYGNNAQDVRSGLPIRDNIARLKLSIHPKLFILLYDAYILLQHALSCFFHCPLCEPLKTQAPYVMSCKRHVANGVHGVAKHRRRIRPVPTRTEQPYQFSNRMLRALRHILLVVDNLRRLGRKTGTHDLGGIFQAHEQI